MTEFIKPCILSLVYMGDSIIFGQYIDAKLRWTSLVTERLQKLFLDTPAHIYAVNRGVSGDTTRMGLERFPTDVQKERPDILVIQFGLNDCNCWLTDQGLPRVSDAAFQANLVEMVVRGQRFGAKRILLLTNHPTLRCKVMPSGEPYEQANARYSEIIRQVAVETKTSLCDIRQAFAGYPTSRMEDLLLPYPDGVHLSIKGHCVYVDIVWPCILEAVQTVLHDTMGIEKR